jgi:hypothetical protein
VVGSGGQAATTKEGEELTLLLNAAQKWIYHVCIDKAIKFIFFLHNHFDYNKFTINIQTVRIAIAKLHLRKTF